MQDWRKKPRMLFLNCTNDLLLLIQFIDANKVKFKQILN